MSSRTLHLSVDETSSGSSPAPAGRWRLDPERSSVEFHVRHFYGLVTVKGHFDRYEGTLDQGARPAIQLTIEAASLDTGNARRDKHLRSPEFFDAERQPQVSFVSDSAVLDGEKLKLRGSLPVRQGDPARLRRRPAPGR